MIIDDRDGSRELCFLYPLNEIAILSRLDSGDVSVTGNGPDNSVVSVGVECKTVSDLLQSEGNGRLQEQLQRMLKAYDVCWLLTYGKYRGHPGTGALQTERGSRWKTERQGGRDLPIGYVEGAILSYTAAGVLHKHVEDEQQAAFWLAVLERWWDKPWDKHKAFHKFNRSGDLSLVPDVSPDMFQRMRTAASLPGIGWERAVAAALSFSSVREMINATAADWENVPGVGPVIAKSIVKAVS